MGQGIVGQGQSDQVRRIEALLEGQENLTKLSDPAMQTPIMIRLVLGKNDLLTPFDLRGQNFVVYGHWSTLQYDGLKKIFFRAKIFFRPIF